MDFGFYQARPLEEVVREAGSVKELKQGIEETLAFFDYEDDLNKQAHIGNYVYPAMREGIVNNFYWVVPGSAEDFQKSRKALKNLLRGLLGQSGHRLFKTLREGKGFLRFNFYGRRFFVCCLDALPTLKQPILLDIDADFLVTKNIQEDSPLKHIGQRRLRVKPSDLVCALRDKLKLIKIVTISYSVNGGWTPMRYKYLGDELAYCFSPLKFFSSYRRSLGAARAFASFLESGRAEDYECAVRIHPGYRAEDNNYGPLYMSKGNYILAKKEFRKIMKVDPKNPAAFLGMGRLFLRKKEYAKAQKCLLFAWQLSGRQRFFKPLKRVIPLELGRAAFWLKKPKESEMWLLRHRKLFPLEPEGYFLSGLLAENKRDFQKAAYFYKDALRLGWDSVEGLLRLAKISLRLPPNSDIIKFTILRYRVFQKGLKSFKKNFRLKARMDRVIEREVSC